MIRRTAVDSRASCSEPAYDGRTSPQASGRAPDALTPEYRGPVLFVLDVVDLLAARYGFDPAGLISPRTGRPLGPELARLRNALEPSSGMAVEDGLGASSPPTTTMRAGVAANESGSSQADHPGVRDV
jgi:hypothetical protein